MAFKQTSFFPRLQRISPALCRIIFLPAEPSQTGRTAFVKRRICRITDLSLAASDVHSSVAKSFAISSTCKTSPITIKTLGIQICVPSSVSNQPSMAIVQGILKPFAS